MVGSPTVPEPTPLDVELRHPDGYALARRTELSPQDRPAKWSALREYRLLPRVRTPQAMATLLRQWLDLALAGGWDDDTEMIVSWPSRDTAMIPLFKNHGFVPKTVIAVRPTRPAEPMTEGATVIRPIRAADIAVACDLWCEVVDWDNQFTGHPRRETTRAQLHAELVSAVTHPDTTWVAEVAGDVVGLLDLSAPSKSDWIRPVVAAAPVSYLGCLVTTASHRGAGVGAALVNQAHRAVAGFPAVANLLHYNALNPLSGPFWHRAGYRPLWTQWVRAWRG